MCVRNVVERVAESVHEAVVHEQDATVTIEQADRQRQQADHAPEALVRALELGIACLELRHHGVDRLRQAVQFAEEAQIAQRGGGTAVPRHFVGMALDQTQGLQHHALQRDIERQRQHHVEQHGEQHHGGQCAAQILVDEARTAHDAHLADAFVAEGHRPLADEQACAVDVAIDRLQFPVIVAS